MFGFQTSDLFNNNKENISVAVGKKNKKKRICSMEVKCNSGLESRIRTSLFFIYIF